MRKAVLFAVLLTACGGDAPEADEAATEVARSEPAAEVSPYDVSDEMFAPELGVELAAMEKQESGLYIQVLEEGEGPVTVRGDAMGVDYTVWLPDGNKLDSSFDHTPPGPYPMILGETPLIAGWVEGVTGMRLGEKRRLVVPYPLAYGEAGRPGVPPATPLVFELTIAEHTPAAK